MSFTTPSEQSIQSFYSFDPAWAAGLRYQRWHNDDRNESFTGAQLNHLLRRWNGPEYQANIYLMAGAGHSSPDEYNAPSGFGIMGGVQADYETRQFYSAAKFENFYDPGAYNHLEQEYRLGFAPYKTSYEEAQPWLMIQAKYSSQFSEKVEITPLLRVIHKSFLTEIGVSLDGEPMFNIMYHF